MITYRDATVADARALGDFSRDTFVATFGHMYPPEDLRDYLAVKYGEAIQRAEIEDGATHYRLALKDGEIVGYCKSGDMTMAVEPQPDERALELHRLYVREDVKGQRVAQTLMDEALEWARGKGATSMYLSVWEDNHRAQAFYRRYGFAHVMEHSFMVGRVADRDFIWRLHL